MTQRPLFQDCLDGGRGQKTLHVSHATAGVLLFAMARDVGPDAVRLSHELQRTDVVDLVNALSAWLDSPESVMPSDDDAGPEPTCSICYRVHSQCTCRAHGYR